MLADLATLDLHRLSRRRVHRVMTAKRGFWLTGGLAVTLWGVGAALRALMRPLNAVYGTREHRSWRRRLLTSIGGGVLVAAALTCTWPRSRSCSASSSTRSCAAS